MKKLSTEKRNQLILIGIATAGVIGCLWFFLLSAQRQKIADINGQIEKTNKKIGDMELVKKSASQVETQLKQYQERLTAIESAMPSGDPYLWINTTLRQFNLPGYKVEMASSSLPIIGSMSMFPNFPYNQSTVSVSGSAFYWDLGRFLADFENRFTCMRVQNVDLAPGGGGTPEDREKIAFHLEIITLTKVNAN